AAASVPTRRRPPFVRSLASSRSKALQRRWRRVFLPATLTCRNSSSRPTRSAPSSTISSPSSSGDNRSLSGFSGPDLVLDPSQEPGSSTMPYTAFRRRTPEVEHVHDHGPVRKRRSAILDRSALQQGRSFATLMVHVEVARDCEQRVQLALALADRFQ